ncbi:MAG: CoB--CoM heterodisulfide reductase iron-sulfur subunit A family protein, partial [Deltaproteobacteria bacterium]|nr:CoB--CoM heterodisulfide reductase iron-sulfur subunit A family protein [Deltaproteobacteria bacterium]
RYVDLDKCIGCGMCAEKCPKKVPDAYEMGLSKRKAIYVKYAQAVPLKYAIDPEQCIYLTKGKCGNCAKVCPAGAVNYEDKETRKTLNVGAVILAQGSEGFDPVIHDNLGYGKLKNVVTSLEFERLLSASGPTQGHLVRLSDKKEPKKIAWLQCVGSRDMNKCDHSYCSSVCCMYAIKEATIAKEHAGEDLDCAVFYMDIRTHGKDFERYYNKAREKDGVRFIRCKVHTVTEAPKTGELSIRYVTDEGGLAVENFDMVVLSIGLQVKKDVMELAEKLGVELTPGHFVKSKSLAPVATSVEGIYTCGVLAGPKDIPQSVVDASATAAAAGEVLAEARGTQAKVKQIVPERPIKGEPNRIGVFVCKCGINIAGVVDVPAVVEYAKGLPGVVYVQENLYSCSQDNQEAMKKVIQEQGLNKVVVAACTPKTHEPLFQDTLVDAGLNRYLFEMTNIRNQDSWVHKDVPELATEKAKDLVRMAVNKVALQEPLAEAELPINQTALVIGGGIAGLSAALSLSAQGYETHVVDRNEQLGGQALSLHKTAKGELVSDLLAELVSRAEKDENIHVHVNTTVSAVEGFVGNFKTTLTENGNPVELEHGVAIVATGGSESKPEEYLYGSDPRVVTAQELDRKFIEDDPSLSKVESAVFIQCVGSREPHRPYCSRVCCTHSVESALELKRRNPEASVFILYRDLRTYGERELLYKEARQAGVIFVRFTVDDKPKVEVSGGELTVTVKDHILGRTIQIPADLVTLAAAIVPNKDEKLAQMFKVPLNEDGFFVERHAKLGPSEFATDGVFLCGLAHYPKPVDEAAAQGQAAAARAVTLLAKKTIHTSGVVARTDPAMCSSCGICVSVCPYSAPSFIAEGPNAGKAEINPVLCKGCGLCVASCRSGAIHLLGFDNDQIFAMINAL